MKYLWVAIAGLALFASGCSKMSGARPDTQVAADVKNRIVADTNVPDKQVEINAANGVVTLSGAVSSDAVRNAVANDAAQVEGVKTVVNNLQVNPALAANTAPPQDTQTSQSQNSQNQTSQNQTSQNQTSQNQQASNNPSPMRESRPSPRRTARAYREPARRSSSSEEGARKQGDPTDSANNNQSGNQGNNMDASNQAPPPPAPEPTSTPVQAITIPSGTTLAIRLNEELSSEKAQVGDVFHGSVSTPVSVDGQVVIPTTADVEGRVVDVKSAGRFKGQSDLVIELTQVLMNGKRYSVVTDRWNKEGSSRGKATGAKIGGGAALGAIIGAIAGGGKGAAIGAAAGAGAGTGVAGATKGQQIILKPETVLNFQLQNPVSVVPTRPRDSMNSN